MNDYDYNWEVMKIGVRKGASLSNSRKSPGDYSPLVRDDDSGDLVGQVILRQPNDEGDNADNRDAVKTLGVFAGGFLLGVVIIKEGPRVKRWLNASVIPCVKSYAKKAMGVLSDGGPENVLERTTIGDEAGLADKVDDFLEKVDVVIDESELLVDTEEEKERLLSILVAAAYIADQLRSPLSVSVDEIDLAKAKGIFGKLSVQRVVDAVNRVLESEISLLSVEARNEFMKLFSGGGFVDGEYVPVRVDKVKDVLSLAANDVQS